MNVLLLGLGGVGLLISCYFFAIYQGWLRGRSWLVPSKICSKNQCMNVLLTPYARVFGLPNFTLGIAYYLVIMGLSFDGIGGTLLSVVRAISLLVVLFSVYLAHSLIVKLRVNCTLCFASHLINLGIALVLMTLG